MLDYWDGAILMDIVRDMLTRVDNTSDNFWKIPQCWRHQNPGLSRAAWLHRSESFKKDRPREV
jgi:hypothetical protein